MAFTVTELEVPQSERGHTSSPPKKKSHFKINLLSFILALFALSLLVGINLYTFFSLNAKISQLNEQVNTYETQIEHVESLLKQMQLDVDSLIEMNAPPSDMN